MQPPFHGKFPKLFMLSMMVSHQVAAEDDLDLRFGSFPNDAGREAFELHISDAEPLKIDSPANRVSKAYVVPDQENRVIGRSLAFLDESQDERARFAGLMCLPPYLESGTLVGEQIRYVAVVDGTWPKYLLTSPFLIPTPIDRDIFRPRN